MIGSQNDTSLQMDQEENSTIPMATETTMLIPNKPSSDSEYNHTMAYVFIMIGVLLIMALVVFVVSFFCLTHLSHNPKLMTLRMKALENIEGKGENAGNHHLLLFPQFF